jgi:hypothetical protein
MSLKPCEQLKRSIQTINYVFDSIKIPYWLSFGGLIALVRKNGEIPDGDLDICCHYKNSDKHKKIIAMFESRGYKLSKALQNDIDKEKILYCGFNYSNNDNKSTKEEFFPHICLSFWYPHNSIAYWCHDQNKEVHGYGVPASGFYFKGLPTECIEEDKLKKVEWPGLSGDIKISAPMMPGTMLDHMYPCWAYNKQKYIPKPGEIHEDKMEDLCKTGATSPYMIHVKSMTEFNNDELILKKLAEAKIIYDAKIKVIRKKQ